SVDLAGSKQLSASSGALTPRTSTAFTVSAAAAASLAFTTQPSNVVAGATMSPGPRVKVVDAFGNGVAGAPVTLSLVGSGTLTGGAPVLSDATGTATFAGLSVDLVGSKQLTASTGVLTPVSSNAFTVSVGAASALVFFQQPSAIAAGATITPAVTVRVQDAFGNAVAGAPVSLGLV